MIWSGADLARWWRSDLMVWWLSGLRMVCRGTGIWWSDMGPIWLTVVEVWSSLMTLYGGLSEEDGLVWVLKIEKMRSWVNSSKWLAQLGKKGIHALEKLEKKIVHKEAWEKIPTLLKLPSPTRSSPVSRVPPQPLPPPILPSAHPLSSQ